MDRKKVLGIIAIAIFLSQALIAGAAVGESERKAVLLVCDGISPADIIEARPPHLQELIRTGGIGLMNTRSAREGDTASGYLTIGSGALAEAPGQTEAGLAFNADRVYEGRPVAEIYESQNKGKADEKSVVVLTAPLLARRNAERNYGARPGLLGETLRLAGKKVGVAGNADFSSKHNREAALIAMDKSGFIPKGEVERELLVQEEESPFGLSTDYRKLLATSLKLLKESDLLVVELGDSLRANSYSDFLTEEATVRERRKALLKADAFVGGLLKARRGKNDLIMFVSPNPPASFREEPGELTLLVARGPGISRGLLTSPTTRRKGLVTNTDIAPTILEHLRVPVPEEMSGRSIRAMEGKATPHLLLETEKKIMATAVQRKPVLTVYVAVVFVLLVLGALSLPLAPETHLLRTIQFSLIWALAVPLALLVLPLLPSSSLELTSIFVACLSGLVAGLAWLTSKHFVRAVGSVALATALLISVDIVLGAPLMRWSLLGYDPLIGARFYGIGNEYMGVLIGSSLTGATILLDTNPKRQRLLLPLTGASFVLLILLIGHPRLGANTGGTIAAAAAFLLAYMRLRGTRLTLRNIALIAVLVLLIVSAFVTIDYLNAAKDQSHAGKTVSLIRKEGAKSALDIIKRKAATNFKLIQWTIWSKVFIVSLLIFAFVFSKPIGVFKRIAAKYPNITSGIYAIIAGSVVALIFNDSGVVAAATMIIFGVITLLHMAIERERGLV
jgi:hypothetical protein